MDAQKRIRELMEERNWTDYRLAKEANLSHSTVTNMFNRNNAPTLPTLEAVCRAFGITLAQFFAEGEESRLTEEQQKLFSKWSTLTDRQKQILLELMDAIWSTSLPHWERCAFLLPLKKPLPTAGAKTRTLYVNLKCTHSRKLGALYQFMVRKPVREYANDYL